MEKKLNNEMEEIFEAIKQSAIKIKNTINTGDTGYINSINATGDNQLKLDVISDKIIEDELVKVKNIHSLISEEKEDALLINENGKYIVGYDPLDGSSLIDVNLSIGSIFGIYETFLDGSSLKAAIYVVYGPKLELVIAKEDVKLFRLNDNNEFIFIKNIKLNEKGKLNSPGSTQKCWSASHKKLIEGFFQEGYRLRYSGGMVPDLHQILLKGGGLFSYPKTSDLPKGKLRMIFEVFPFAFIFEKANGGAVDGKTRLLNLKPLFIHDTTPCFFGSNYEIKKVIDSNE